MATYPSLFAGQRITAALLTSMQPLHAAKTATTDRTSTTTITADPELQIAVAASAEYIFTFYLRISGTTAGDMDMKVTTPSGGSGSFSMTRLVAASGLDSGTRSSTRIAMNATTEFSPVSQSANQVIEGSGRLYTSSAGTFSIDWAQHTSSAVTTSMHADSWIQLRRIS